MRDNRGWISGLLALLSLCACSAPSMTATGISEKNAISLAGVIGDIPEKVALDNIAVAIAEPSAIPSQMTIKQGIGIGNLSFAPTWTTTNLRRGLANGIKVTPATASTATGVPLQN